MAELVSLSSESDSDEAMDIELLAYVTTKRKKTVWKSAYMKKRKTHGEYALTAEFTDKQFNNYFRLSRDQFNEVNELLKCVICSEGCNAQRAIEREEKLAIFLRYVC